MTKTDEQILKGAWNSIYHSPSFENASIVGHKDVILKAMSEARAAGREEANEWISVEERMPPNNDEHQILIWCKQGGRRYASSYIGMYYNNTFSFSHKREFITHWQPINPPKK